MYGYNSKVRFILTLLLTITPATLSAAERTEHFLPNMVLVPEGTYAPFLPQRANPTETPPPVRVGAFWMDVTPVTNQQYRNFVQQNPQWKKSHVKSVFADPHYLDQWKSDLAWKDKRAGNAPVTNVSWFTAKAFCEAKGKSLPTTDQWEYALADQGRNQSHLTEMALAWYSAANPTHIPNVGITEKNGFGLHDLIGLVWEWTLDFNSFMVSTELRDTDGKDKGLFCGAGSQGVKDATDYAAFMRYALRTSLKADYTTNNLGFRCVKEIP